MCTAIHYGNFFGRNLDLDISYGEQVIVSPRNFCFSFRKTSSFYSHYAIIGIGTVANGYPLYYDGVNEKGLAMAGLNFPDNAHYFPETQEKQNISPFELIPYILGKCASVSEAKQMFKEINLANIHFSKELPLSPLHWMISDKDSSIVVEPLKSGIMTYDNPIGVLTNNPTFDYHLINLSNYMNVTPKEPKNRFSDKINISPYSRGMGGIGIPGDLSSASRFVKAAFTLLNSPGFCDKHESLSQFFHILTSVKQQKGCVHINDKYEFTIYSSCCDLETATYYYTTYKNPAISAVYLSHENIDGDNIITYPLSDNILINNIN